jgi:hypothetical protein
MAQKVQVVLTCDLDEDEVPAVQTVTFGYDGYSYAFELCEQHLEEFNEQMHGYIASARLADGPRRRRASAASEGRPRRSASEPPSGDIRSWARGAGYEISDRGRIPADIRSAYEEARG